MGLPCMMEYSQKFASKAGRYTKQWKTETTQFPKLEISLSQTKNAKTKRMF